MSLLRALAFTGIAWGVAFAATWAVVVTLGNDVRRTTAPLDARLDAQSAQLRTMASTASRIELRLDELSKPTGLEGVR